MGGCHERVKKIDSGSFPYYTHVQWSGSMVWSPKNDPFLHDLQISPSMMNKKSLTRHAMITKSHMITLPPFLAVVT